MCCVVVLASGCVQVVLGSLRQAACCSCDESHRRCRPPKHLREIPLGVAEGVLVAVRGRRPLGASGLRGLGVRRQSHVVHVLPEASHGVSRVRECQADNVVTARVTVASKAQNSGHASFGQSRRPVRRPRLKHSRTRWSYSEQADGEQALRNSCTISVGFESKRHSESVACTCESDTLRFPAFVSTSSNAPLSTRTSVGRFHRRTLVSVHTLGCFAFTPPTRSQKLWPENLTGTHHQVRECLDAHANTRTREHAHAHARTVRSHSGSRI